jgi:hypothetical protein
MTTSLGARAMGHAVSLLPWTGLGLSFVTMGTSGLTSLHLKSHVPCSQDQVLALQDVDMPEPQSYLKDYRDSRHGRTLPVQAGDQ